jgi:hypothetical protein
MLYAQQHRRCKPIPDLARVFDVGAHAGAAWLGDISNPVLPAVVANCHSTKITHLCPVLLMLRPMLALPGAEFQTNNLNISIQHTQFKQPHI